MSAKYTVLGVPIDAVQIPEAVDRIEAWIESRVPGHYITVNAMHSVLAAHDSPELLAIQRKAAMAVPDGKPIVMIGRFKGHELPRRVYGPELMMEFCKKTGERYRHFFYGGTEGVAEKLAARLKDLYGTTACGCHTPSFHPLEEAELNTAVDIINACRPDILWVGLPSPKQEFFMGKLAARLSVPVMVGVGAAFDFNAGIKKQAPRWMGDIGFEWLFRLACEPRRLGGRYFRGGSRFLYLCIRKELLNRRKAETY